MILLQIWVPSNPRGAERLPPGIVEAESDFYLRRLWGKPSEVCILLQLSVACGLNISRVPAFFPMYMDVTNPIL